MNILNLLGGLFKVATAVAERADDYVRHNEPKEVETGCWRTTHRADGKPNYLHCFHFENKRHATLLVGILNI